MIFLPEFPHLPNRFPVDKCHIMLPRIRLKNIVGDCPPDKLDSLPPEMRALVHHKKDEAKSEYSTAVSRPASHRYNPTIRTSVIFVRSFCGIKLHAEKNSKIGWVIYMITFNPSSVCHGHNGSVIQEEHFIHACSDLIESVAPLLEDRDDIVYLVPGLRPESCARWKSLEIPYQILDPGGLILRAFTNAKHAEINMQPLYQCREESIAFSNSTKDLLIRIYRKDLELRKKRGKKAVTCDIPVLRIEVELSGAKLQKHFKGGTWKMIDGEFCLVSFRGADLRAAFRSVILRFFGLLSQPPSVVGQNDDKIGRMMGWVASMTDLSVDDQIAYYERRFLKKNNLKCINNTKSRLRKAARKELTLQSTVSLADFFREKSWYYAPAVVCPGLEAMVKGRHMDVTNHPLVEAAYGTRGRNIHPSCSAPYAS